MTLPKQIKLRSGEVLAWPEALTMDIIQEGAERQMFGTDNVGFCVACGEEADGCEPDARGYECDSCGRKLVYGASELLLRYA